MCCYAVIGMGSIAKRHLRNLRFLYPDSDIYVVSSSGKNSDVPEGVVAVLTLEELIKLTPNYVIIASPSPYHVDNAKLLLENNIPVLIEKPLASDSDDALKLLEFCKHGNHPEVAVGYCLRFLPSAIAVKDFIGTDVIGDIYNVNCIVGQYLPEWRSDKNYKDSVSAQKKLGGGVLLELSHEIDYLNWLFGSMTLQHSWLRTTEELGLEVEEIADLVFTTESGIYLSLHLDFIQKTAQRKCEVIGERGRIVWDLIANTVTFFGAKNTQIIYSDAHYDKNLMYLDMLKVFSDIKNRGMQELATIESSLEVIQLIDIAKMTNKGRNIS
tara:strand:- start:154 stop:1131 length:978 start_codon:yes stop_codon:yes gene_type:complete